MFADPALAIRDTRLRQSKQNAEKCQRELKKDRDELERKEKMLVREAFLPLLFCDFVNESQVEYTSLTQTPDETSQGICIERGSP